MIGKRDGKHAGRVWGYPFHAHNCARPGLSRRRDHGPTARDQRAHYARSEQFLVRREQCHVGTPEYVTDRIRKYADELGCNHMILFWAVPLVTFGEYRHSLTLFADKVIPNF